MELARQIGDALDRLGKCHRLEVHENGTWLAALDGFQHELRSQNSSTLLHLWSTEANIVRRVLRLTGENSDRLSLEVARLGKTRPDRLEFIVPATERSTARVGREQFRVQLRRILGSCFPDDDVESLAIAPDLEHSLSGNYVRGTISSRSHRWAIIAAAAGESAATVDGILTFGLLWLDRARKAPAGKPLAGLRIFLPEGTGAITRHRLGAITNSISTELFEYSTSTEKVWTVDPSDRGNSKTRIVSRKEMEELLQEAMPAIASILRRDPDAIRAAPVAGAREVMIRFRGVPFACWKPDGVYFGLGTAERLTTDRQPEFDRLLGKLTAYRSPASGNRRHNLFRSYPERWLELLVTDDPTQIEASLDKNTVYAQVPAFHAQDRGIIDLLGVTRAGRLAVIELKASEDIQLVLQAADYWLRVKEHHERQELSRYGYFSEKSLDVRAPLLFLVAPALQFHPACEVLLRYLLPEIDVCRVGINENWRRGLRVVLRQSRM